MRDKIKFFKRYLDDIVLVWTGSQAEFEEFFQLLKGFHRNMNFTCTPDFENRTTTFLDVNVRIGEGTITTDLYIKPTSANQYLSPLSCHPYHIQLNIPYSLAFRIRRICSEESDFEKQLTKTKTMLLARGYREKIVDTAFNRVRALTREFTLKKVTKQDSNKLTLVLTYDPRLPSIPGVLQKHAKTLKMDSQMQETFADGFQVAFKRHRNVKEFLCRARLYDVGLRRNETRQATKGWRKCNRCMTCSRSLNVTRYTGSATKEIFTISEDICCKDSPTIYILECTKCQHQPQYVGKTTRCLMDRGRDHINAIDKGNFEGSTSGKMYRHFTTNNHTSRDFRIFAIEKVHGDVTTLSVREQYWIRKLDTVRSGLNTYRT